MISNYTSQQLQSSLSPNPASGYQTAKNKPYGNPQPRLRWVLRMMANYHDLLRKHQVRDVFRVTKLQTRDTRAAQHYTETSTSTYSSTPGIPSRYQSTPRYHVKMAFSSQHSMPVNCTITFDFIPQIYSCIRYIVRTYSSAIVAILWDLMGHLVGTPPVHPHGVVGVIR